MDRRHFLTRLLSPAVVSPAVFPLFLASWGSADQTASDLDPIYKSDEEWQQLLTPEQFHILREEGTEPPFSSPLNKEKQAGLYVCAGCQLPLFTSDMKYNSGTGWPSFFTSIEGHLATKPDFKLLIPRTEYHCARCGSHQGHVFKDGPAPTGQRWCNNGLALAFIPNEEAASESLDV